MQGSRGHVEVRRHRRGCLGQIRPTAVSEPMSELYQRTLLGPSAPAARKLAKEVERLVERSNLELIKLFALSILSGRLDYWLFVTDTLVF